MYHAEHNFFANPHVGHCISLLTFHWVVRSDCQNSCWAVLEIIHIWSNHTFCADSVDNIFWGIRETMPVYVLLCFLVCTAQHTQCRDSTDWGHWGLVHLTQRWASRLQLLRRRVQHAIAHFQKFWLKSNWKLKITLGTSPPMPLLTVFEELQKMFKFLKTNKH